MKLSRISGMIVTLFLMMNAFVVYGATLVDVAPASVNQVTTNGTVVNGATVGGPGVAAGTAAGAVHHYNNTHVRGARNATRTYHHRR